MLVKTNKPRFKNCRSNPHPPLAGVEQHPGRGLLAFGCSSPLSTLFVRGESDTSLTQDPDHSPLARPINEVKVLWNVSKTEKQDIPPTGDNTRRIIRINLQSSLVSLFLSRVELFHAYFIICTPLFLDMHTRTPQMLGGQKLDGFTTNHFTKVGEHEPPDEQVENEMQLPYTGRRDRTPRTEVYGTPPQIRTVSQSRTIQSPLTSMSEEGEEEIVDGPRRHYS